MELIYIFLKNLRFLFRDKNIRRILTIAILILLFSFILQRFFSVPVFATTGNVERDNIIKNNFYYLKKYVNEHYGDFKDYVIVDNTGWIDCFILNPNGGYARNNGHGVFHSNYSLIFNLGTELRDADFQWKPSVDHWNSAPNMSTYSSVPNTVFTTIPISGTDCSDTLGDIETLEPYVPFVLPSLKTSNDALKYWSFDYIEIDGGTFDLNKGEIYFAIAYNPTLESPDDSPFQKYEKSTKIYLSKNSPYVSFVEENGHAFFTAKIPRIDLLKNATLRNGGVLGYGLHGRYYEGTMPNGDVSFSVNDNVLLVLDSNTEEDIENEKTSQQAQEIIETQKETNNKIDETNQKLDETNDFLKDDSVPSDSDFELPSIDVADPTTNFFDTLFTGLYNAISTTEEKEITFSVFNSEYSISSSDFNFLNNSKFAFLKSILSLLWIYRIGISILKDVRAIIDKIKKGDIDTAVTSDIKADMV